MKAIRSKRAWLRWILLAPLACVYADASCGLADSMRSAADQLNKTADAIGGEADSGKKVDRFLDAFGDLFD